MPQSDLYLDKDKKAKGIKMPLLDGGRFTDDYIMVYWSHTDSVRAAIDKLKRDMREQFAGDGDPDQESIILDGQVALVAGWGGPTFDKKATKKNVRELLLERPDIAERIDTLSAKTKLFFSDKGSSS